MLKKLNFRQFTKKGNSQSIKEMNQSKEMDTIEKDLQRNQEYLKQQFYSSNQRSIPHNSGNNNFQSVNDRTSNTKQKELNLKYFTSNNDDTEQRNNVQKFKNTYHSGEFNSTQPASPYNNLSTGRNLRDDRKSEFTQDSIKKKLFYHDEGQKGSPQFKNLRQSAYRNLAFTFKKKIDEYQNTFGSSFQTQMTQKDQNKIQYSRISYQFNDNGVRTQPKLRFQENNYKDYISSTNQNDSSKLNKKIQPESSINTIKKRLTFQKLTFDNKQQPNEFIKQINQEIRNDKHKAENNNTKTFRNHQNNLVRAKILESKSDLKRFYQNNSQNVQYEYRKAKFMDIFLGVKTIEHEIIR